MKKVLITGGSSGIGFEMSRHFARNGFELFWVSHDSEELSNAKNDLEKEINGVVINTLQQDLTDFSGPDTVYEWTKNEHVDVIINNAGFGTYGYVNEINTLQELKMIDLNIVALYKLTRYFLNDFIKRDDGTIINICSNSAFQPVPRMTTYAATKGFVYQFSRALQEEMDITGSEVRILTVCPAAIRDTPFKSHLSKKVKTFEGIAATTAEEVASDIWKAFRKNKTFIVSGKKMRRLYNIRGLLPPALQRFLVRKETEAQ